jgi:epoxyqueuosine reductase QueG
VGDLTQEVKSRAIDQGAHLVGIASVDRFEGAPKGHHPTDLLRQARSVIVIAHRFFQGVLEADRFGVESELIPEEERWEVQTTVFKFMYDTANMRMQQIGAQLAYLLEEHGHASLPLPAGGFKVGAGRYAFFSHRHAAVAAGLGEFGLNNLLLTPDYGPRVRLNSIITTAELDPDPLYQGAPICPGEEGCGLCLRAHECFGQIEDFVVAGKRMPVARFLGCPSDLCKRQNPEGVLPYIRFCWGVCPVGKKGVGHRPAERGDG